MMPTKEFRDKLEAELEPILQKMCADAYWYHERTGDVDMAFVGEEDWFKAAKDKIIEDVFFRY